MVTEKTFASMMATLITMTALGLMAGIYMFEASLTIALAAWIGLMMLYFMSWPGVKRLIVKTRIFWDLGITVGTPLIMGNSITGILAGILLGIMTTMTLKFEHLRVNRLFSFQKKMAEKSLG